MAVDVVPALLDDVQTSFNRRVATDKRAKRVSSRIRDGTATFEDAHLYAERLGFDLSGALLENITEDTLPNGELYFNIADRIVTPTLKTNYDMINEVAEEIQYLADRDIGIGLAAVHADFPENRAAGLVDKLANMERTIEERLVWLGEPIVNFSEALADDFVKANADTRAKVGLETTITRVVAPGCCAWCDAIAGTYQYGQEPRDIYKRHEFCRCVVTYQSGRTSQNVWTKQKWQSTPEELAARRAAGLQIRPDGGVRR